MDQVHRCGGRKGTLKRMQALTGRLSDFPAFFDGIFNIKGLKFASKLENRDVAKQVVSFVYTR